MNLSNVDYTSVFYIGIFVIILQATLSPLIANRIDHWNQFITHKKSSNSAIMNYFIGSVVGLLICWLLFVPAGFFFSDLIAKNDKGNTIILGIFPIRDSFELMFVLALTAVAMNTFICGLYSAINFLVRYSAAKKKQEETFL